MLSYKSDIYNYYIQILKWKYCKINLDTAIYYETSFVYRPEDYFGMEKYLPIFILWFQNGRFFFRGHNNIAGKYDGFTTGSAGRFFVYTIHKENRTIHNLKDR